MKLSERLINAINGDGVISCKNAHAIEDAVNFIRKYEDAEEQGRLVILPCKVGDAHGTRDARPQRHPCRVQAVRADRQRRLPPLHAGKEGGSTYMNDPVNHPAHYTAGGVECIDAITAALACQIDPVSAWLTGQVIKYLWRWPQKNGAEDLRKARWYLERLIAHEEGK